MHKELDEKTKLFLSFFDGEDIGYYKQREIIRTIHRQGRCGSFLSLDDMKRLRALYDKNLIPTRDIITSSMRSERSNLGYCMENIKQAFYDFLFMTRGSFPNVSKIIRSIDPLSMFTVSLIRSIFKYSRDTIMPFNVSSDISKITRRQELLNTIDAFENYIGVKANDDTIDMFVSLIISKYTDIFTHNTFNVLAYGLYCNNYMLVELTYMDPDKALQYWNRLESINQSEPVTDADKKDEPLALQRLVANQSLSTKIFDKGMEMIMSNHHLDMLRTVYTYNENMESIPFSMVIDAFDKVEPSDEDFDAAFNSILTFNEDIIDGTIHITEGIIINLLFASIISRNKGLTWIYLQFFTFIYKYKNDSKNNKRTMGRVITFRKGEMDRDFIEYMSSLPYDFVKEEFLRRIKASNTAA